MRMIRSRYGNISTTTTATSRNAYIKTTRPGISSSSSSRTSTTLHGVDPPGTFHSYSRFSSARSSSSTATTASNRGTTTTTTFGGASTLNIKTHRRPICVPPCDSGAGTTGRILSASAATPRRNSSAAAAIGGGAGGRKIMSLAMRSPRSRQAARSAAAAAAASRGGVGDKRKASHINVCVRLRPLNANEPRNETVVEVVDGNTLVFDPEYNGRGGTTYGSSATGSVFRSAGGGVSGGGGSGVRRGKNSAFGFDHVYDVRATQEEVYRGATEGLVRSVLEGFNASVFAYGATGSGKTYTMMGNETTPGVMGLAMQELWEAIEESSGEYSYEVKVSCLEVYNEKLYDLFVADSPYLEMREDDSGNVCVPRLSVEHPRTVEEVQSMLALANSRRKQSPTDANAESSRSHAVFQVTVLRTPRTVGLTAPTSIGKLSLIDLAGSERASQSKNNNKQFREGANINRSLLALNSCISALGRNYRVHIPYRNSNLTRLLKDSLGGTARTTMIANISPSARSYEDTFNTLTYASNAKNIRINARPKTEDARTHISNYKAIIESLTAQVADLKAQLAGLQAERKRCSCGAKDDLHNRLLERARNVCAERAATLRQLEVICNRLRKFAEIKYADGDDEPPLLRETRRAKENALAKIRANGLAALQLSNEIDRLPRDKAARLLAEITGVAGDMVAAHGAFMRAVVHDDAALLSSIFSSGAISSASPILPQLQTAILIGDSVAGLAPLSFVPTPFPASSLSSTAISSATLSSSSSSSSSAAIPSAFVQESPYSMGGGRGGGSASMAASGTEMDLINVSGTFNLNGGNSRASQGAVADVGVPGKPHPTIDDLATSPSEFSFSSNAARTPLKNIYTLAQSSPFKSVKRAFPAESTSAAASSGDASQTAAFSSPLKRLRVDESAGASSGASTAQTIVFPSVPSFSFDSPEKGKDFGPSSPPPHSSRLPEPSPPHLSEATAASLLTPRSAMRSSSLSSSLTLSSSTLALMQQQQQQQQQQQRVQDQQEKDNRAADLINKAASFTTGQPFIPSASSSLTSSTSSSTTSSLQEHKRVGFGLAKSTSTVLESASASSSGESETRVPSIEQVKQLRGILKTSGRNEQTSGHGFASSGLGNDGRSSANASGSGSERGSGSAKTVTFLEPGKNSVYKGKNGAYGSSSDSDSDESSDESGESESESDNENNGGKGRTAQFKRSPHPIFSKRANLTSGSGSSGGKQPGAKYGNSGSGSGNSSSAASFFQPKSRWLSNKL